MREKVLEILKGVREDVDFEKETQLIDNNIIDSFDLISIISELNEQFVIEITAVDIESSNFNSLDAIVAMVERLQ